MNSLTKARSISVARSVASDITSNGSDDPDGRQKNWRMEINEINGWRHEDLVYCHYPQVIKHFIIFNSSYMFFLMIVFNKESIL